MTIKQRAAVNTALAVGVIAIIIAIATVWPPILGYVLSVAVLAIVIGTIYLLFYVIEDLRRNSNKWK